MKIKSFVDENDAVSYVARQLGISSNESEELYAQLGGYQGYSVTIDKYSSGHGPFAECILAFMVEHNIESLDLRHGD